MLDELLALPGVEERCVLRSRVGFLALHGGLEAETAEIASSAADAAEASLYAVVQPEELRWHVPSHRYDPAHSPGLTRFLDHVNTVISVHGYGGLRGDDERWITILLGGSNRDLANELAHALRVAMPAYRFLDDIERIPEHLRGLHRSNPVNRAQRGGVQIELPPRIRRDPDRGVLVNVLAQLGREQRQEV